MGRSATNAIGNSIATAAVAKWEGELMPPQADEPIRGLDNLPEATSAA
jgi:Na+/H+-dicarboxylate symporter